MEYLGAWGTLIHEKNLKSKILCKTPFKYFLQGFKCVKVSLKLSHKLSLFLVHHKT
jgi:hypothetical protein